MSVFQGLDGEIVELVAREFGFKMINIRTQEEQTIEEHKQQEGNGQTIYRLGLIPWSGGFPEYGDFVG